MCEVSRYMVQGENYMCERGGKGKDGQVFIQALGGEYTIETNISILRADYPT